MAISISKKPNLMTWSKNPIVFSFTYTGGDASWKLQVQLTTLDGSVIAEVQYPVQGYTGGVDIPVHDLIDPYISDVLPGNLSGGTTDANTEVSDNILSYKIQYRFIGSGLSNPFTVDSHTYQAIKGYMGDLDTNGEYDVNYTSYAMFLPNNSQWLTWVPSGRIMTPTEWGWLMYFTLDNPYAPTVKYTMTYMDGTTATISKVLINTTGPTDYSMRTWFVPIGISQAKLDPTIKGVQYYTIQVQDSNGDLSAAYKINVDNAPYYNTMTLFYRNSFGGIDQIQLKGMIDWNIETVKSEYEQRRYYPPNTNGTNPFYDATLRPSWTGNTGYLSKSHVIALQELLGGKYCALLYDGQWLPVRVPANKFTIYSKKDALHNVAITFEAAATFKGLPRQLQGLV